MEYIKRDHLTLVQEQFQGKTFQNITFERSDIDNCKIENCRFLNCSFDRCSITCVCAKDCVFEGCKFRNADILSNEMANCRFQECDFSLVTFCDNTSFQDQFAQPNFLSANIKGNEFLFSTFVHASFRGSMISLNIFRQATIKDSEFGNCTVDYNISEYCVFQRSWLNIEILGTFFGLRSDDMLECRFLLLGEEIVESDCEALYNSAQRQFEQEGRYMEQFLLDINRSFDELLPATERLCINLKQRMFSGDHVPSDQLQFLFHVYKELYRQKHLGFLALYQLERSILEILDGISPTNKCYEKVLLLYNDLGLLHRSMTADLAALAEERALEDNNPMIVRFKFEKKPQIAMDEILEICYCYVFDCAPAVRPAILAEQSGSYVVFLTMTVQTFVAFRICTYLLSGSIKELVKIRANTTLLVQKKLPKKYFLEVTKPESTVTVPQATAALLTKLIKKVLPEPLKNIPLSDISEDNLKEVQEVSQKDVPTKHHDLSAK